MLQNDLEADFVYCHRRLNETEMKMFPGNAQKYKSEFKLLNKPSKLSDLISPDLRSQAWNTFVWKREMP